VFMKRRDFLSRSTAGALGLGLSGCSSMLPQQKKTALWKELAPFSPRPKGGTMPMGELGTTGIKISKFGFGSHIRAEMRGYDKQRTHTIREAFDLGVNVFDVYDEEQGVSIGGSYQYEPFGKQIAPIKNDVLISISFRPYDGRTPEQEIERDMKLFGRDHIDLVRILRQPDNEMWDTLFKFKEKGYIRAVGAPIHDMKHADMLIGKVPIDYMLLPYNFYHNICWLEEKEDDFESLPARLRKHGIGVLTMKPFAGDYLVQPFMKVAQQVSDNPELSFPKAALRYVINSGINADSTLVGMYNLPHLYENVAAYLDPTMSDEERELLNGIKRAAPRKAQAHLPGHYRWLEKWA
ncbi:aldo/keto reductase, partial [Candidatus Latescibacterota bacterium]